MITWLNGFSGRHPLFMAACAAVVCVSAAAVAPGLGGSAGMLCAVSGMIFAGWKRGLIWGLCGWIPVAVFLWRSDSQRTAEAELLAAPGGEVTARVLQDGKGSERFWSAPARITGGPHAGRKVWWQGGGEVPVAGAVVGARGSFQALQGPRNPGEFDRAAWLRRQGVAAVFYTGWTGGTVEAGHLAAWGAAIRHGFRSRVTAGLPDDSTEAGVIRAVVLGEKPPDSDALIGVFRNSGTLHVFSVSGLHVAMVGAIAWWVLSWAGVSRRRAVPLLLPVIFGYAWITGFGAPAVRAAWMAAVFLGAFIFRRRPDLLNALGAVLFVAMLWDGRLLFQPGVQLSYGVVAAIAVGVAWSSRVFAWMAVPELYLPMDLMNRWQEAWLWLRRKIAQMLSVSLAAGIGSAPLTAAHFGLITPISVLAGLVLVPLVFGLLFVALLAIVVSPLAPPVSRGLNCMNGYVAMGCVHSATFFSKVPGGHFLLHREERPMLLVYDLGHGAGAACFSGGPEAAVLIDCGDRRGFKRTVMPSLRKLGIEPDSVVLSHPDGRHLGGGSAVWDAFPVRQALLPVERSRSPAFRSWIDDGPAAGIRMHQVGLVDSLAFPDGASLEILNVPDSWAVNSVADERVAVYRLHWKGWKFLFTSDAGIGTELKLLDEGRDLSADVIIAGRHRGDLTLCDPFLDAVNPQVIIASNANHPIEERLDSRISAYWKSRGILVMDQARCGGVTLLVDDEGNLSVDGFMKAGSRVFKPRD